MSIALNAVTQAPVSNAASKTVSHTVAGTDRLLLVMVSAVTSTDVLSGATVTYGGTSLGAYAARETTLANHRIYAWLMHAPPAGTANIVVTATAAFWGHVCVVSLTGAHQSAALSASAPRSLANPTNPLSTAITVPSGGVAVDMVSNRATTPTLTPDASQTLLGAAMTGDSFSVAGASMKSGATAMTWSGALATSSGVHMVLAIAPSASGTVNTAPTLSSNVSDISGTAGAAGSSSIAASWSDPGDALTYSAVGTWPSGITISSAGAVAWTTAVAAGTYSLQAQATDTGGLSTPSNTFNLVLSVPVTNPVITTQPTAQSVPAGSTATFSVTATNAASYQWNRRASGTSTWVAISGATANSYTTPTTTLSGGAASDGDQYQCVLTSSSGGTATTTTAELTVTAAVIAPTVSTQPTAQSVTAGAAATFSAVFAGSTPMTFQWERLPVGGPWAAISGATAASYTTPATTVSGGSANSGDQYRCTATNSAGSVTTGAVTLSVGATAALATTVSITLTSDGVTPKASLSGLKWAFFDQTVPSAFTAPVAKGSAGATDGSGLFSASIAGTTLTPGSVGWLSVTDGDGTVSTAHSVFSGPVVVA